MSRIVVLVPVLARPHRVVPLLESLRTASAAEHRALFLVSSDDAAEIEALSEAEAQIHICPPWPPAQGQYARKINLGYRLTDEPWLLLAADDLAFESGWDEEAIRVGEEGTAGVVGTNDGANPAVVRGKHSTHPLVRRAYVEEFGSATFDDSGEIYCEHYDHQLVDDELVLTAKMRGRWAFAADSFVRHQHPLWGTAEWDDTYQRAVRGGASDLALFRQRREAMRLIAHEERSRARALR